MAVKLNLRRLLQGVHINNLRLTVDLTYGEMKRRLLEAFRRPCDILFKDLAAFRRLEHEKVDQTWVRLQALIHEFEETMPGFTFKEAMCHMWLDPKHYGVQPGATGSFSEAMKCMRRNEVTGRAQTAGAGRTG